MSKRKYIPVSIREISSMEDLRYHKMRLDLASDFLEDKIEDNIKDIKYQLSPKHLFRTVLSGVFSLVGSRKRKRREDDDDESDGSSNMLLDGVVALVKAMFRAR